LGNYRAATEHYKQCCGGGGGANKQLRAVAINYFICQNSLALVLLHNALFYVYAPPSAQQQ
jgi:hypothetical protein